MSRTVSRTVSRVAHRARDGRRCGPGMTAPGVTVPDSAQEPDADDVIKAADWRFLLPVPPGGRYQLMAVVGGSPPLLDYLLRSGCTDRITDVLPDDSSASAVVILPDAPVAPRRLASALAGGGALYLEVDRRLRGNRRSTPARMSKELRAAGIAVTGVYAVGRRGLAPRRYVPIDEPSAARWFLRNAYRPVTLAQRVAGAAAATLFRVPAGSALMQRIIPAYALTASVGPTSSAPVMCGGSSEHAELCSRGTRAILFGDGGDRVVALAFPPGERDPATAIKIPRSSNFRERTGNEQACMRDLRAHLPVDLARAIPEPRGVHDGVDWYIASERALPGRMLGVSSGSWGAPVRGRIDDLRIATEWLASFHAATMVERRCWSARETDGLIDALLARYTAVYGETSAERHMHGVAVAYARSLDGTPLPIVWQHRDYTVWNLARSGDALAVLDWEGARVGPALCDMLHFATSWNMAVRVPRGAADELRHFHALFTALFLNPQTRDRYHAAVRGALDSYRVRLGIEERLVPILLLHHRLELALRRADQLADRGSATHVSRAKNTAVAAVAILAEHCDTLFTTHR